MKRKILYIVLGVILFFVAAQLVRPKRTNPPTDASQTFLAIVRPDARVEKILSRACRDCHTNGTSWPWYSVVAPVSWLVADDVNEGRRELNFSEWGRYEPKRQQRKLGRICREVKDGDMPPWYYRPMHPEAKLSAEDVQAICAAFPAAPPGAEGR